MNDGEVKKRVYIPYPKAMQRLKSRLGATPSELASWVSIGPDTELRGIAAYLNANELADPPRLELDIMSNRSCDYIAPLMGAWFIEEEIDSFVPRHRFILFGDLVERWSQCEAVDHVEAYIQAKIFESRLMEAHPIVGMTELTSPENDFGRPLKEETQFYLEHVEAVEREDGIRPKLEETPAQRRERLLALFNEEKNRNPSGALNRTAKQEGVSRQTLSAILDRG